MVSHYQCREIDVSDRSVVETAGIIKQRHTWKNVTNYWILCVVDVKKKLKDMISTCFIDIQWHNKVYYVLYLIYMCVYKI